MDLEELRQRLDDIDTQIVRLVEERMEVSDEVAAYKIAHHRRVLDKAREQEKSDALSAMTSNAFNAKCVRELYDQMMSMSRKLQYKRLAEVSGKTSHMFQEVASLKTDGAKVAYQGARGAYSHAALKAHFGDGVTEIAVDTFRDAFGALEEGLCDYCVLPIENSTAGVVAEVYDLLSEYECYIVAEQMVKVEHCLIGVKGASMEDITTVYSHPQSLMQCAKFLRAHPAWEQVSMKNNAFAVQKIAEDQVKSQAAIASAYAAACYGAQILASGINQSGTNTTRFIIVTGRKIYLQDAKRISLWFEALHEAGSLYRLLSHFIYNDLNMTRIESRPLAGRNWEYRFFVDFEGSLSDESVKNALTGLREEARSLRILGNY